MTIRSYNDIHLMPRSYDPTFTEDLSNPYSSTRETYVCLACRREHSHNFNRIVSTGTKLPNFSDDHHIVLACEASYAFQKQNTPSDPAHFPKAVGCCLTRTVIGSLGSQVFSRDIPHYYVVSRDFPCRWSNAQFLFPRPLHFFCGIQRSPCNKWSRVFFRANKWSSGSTFCDL